MKIYVISDSAEYGVAAVNQINSSGNLGMLSEGVTGDTRMLLGDLRANLGSGYNLIVLICENAKDLAISANKVGGAMAVVCKDQEDATDTVSETRANVVLIPTNRLDRRALSSIISGLLIEEKVEHRKAASAKEREVIQEPRAAQAQAKIGSFLSGIKEMAGNATAGLNKPQQSKPKFVKPAPRMQPSGDGIVKSIKLKGLVKSIKETFGIED